MSDYIGHVVIQTHWDREWYYTREQYLARLIRAAEHFATELERGQIGNFLFDGQTIAVEDLVGACEPALAARLQALMQDGRMTLGPWYVSADEFLVDGECLIRNLERGVQQARVMGNCQNVGYVVDTFGHISQLPQILRGFGIDCAVLWRGCDEMSSEVQWAAPDGSTIFVVLLTQGYYQHPFNEPDWQNAVAAYFETVKQAATTKHLLLTQGGDHLVTNSNVAARIAAFNTSRHDVRLAQASLAGYVSTVRAEASHLSLVTGDLRANGRAFVLPDVLSTRRYLKLANQAAEDRLIGLVEPLLAITTWDMITYPQHYARQTWDILLQQQAHDSICGCSVDAVHDEMMVRFASIESRLDALVDLAGLANKMINDHAGAPDLPDPFADNLCSSLFNPSPKPVRGWFEAEIFLAGDKQEALCATREDGMPIQTVLLAAEPFAAFTSPLNAPPDHVGGHRYRLAIKTDLDGLAMATVEIAPTFTDPAIAKSAVAENAICNAYYECSVDPDQCGVIVTDRASGRKYAGIFSIESTCDAGDTYNYSPLPQSVTKVARVTAHSITDTGTTCETLTIDLVLDQPAGLLDDRSGPTRDYVKSNGQLTLRLLAGEALVRCTLQWDNQAKDHRLRLVLPLHEPVSKSASDGGFKWTERAVCLPDVPAVASRQEARVSVNRTHSVVSAGPFGLIHRGMQEYEIDRSMSGYRLGITLLRSTGWLSRRDLVTRGVGAGPDMPTPGAQCLGEHHYEFALVTNQDDVKLLNIAATWRRPPTVLRGHNSRPIARMMIADERLQVSSFRRVNDYIELRVWNPTAEPVALVIENWRIVATDFEGHVQTDWTGTVKPFGIQTVQLYQALASYQ